MPNIEIKAKCADLTSAKAIAEKLKTDYVGHLHQIDTYYETKTGRLKLREINGQASQLIPYYKDYSSGPMKSSYAVLPVDNEKNLKDILQHILGTVVSVDKMREVYLIDNVRVHLDHVKDLGTFIEFEAVYEETSPEAKEREIHKVSELMDTFKIQKEDLLDRSYIDYLMLNNEFTTKLETLYSFESNTHILAEFKRKDIQASVDADKRFFWFLFDKKSCALNRLNFCSMKSEGGLEQREFREGTLTFDNKEARFENNLILEKHGNSYELSYAFKMAVLEWLA